MGKGTDATEGTDETSAPGRVASRGAPDSPRTKGQSHARQLGARAGRSDRPLVIVEGGRKVLRVGGVIQSVHVDESYEPDVWDAMLPDVYPQRMLILRPGRRDDGAAPDRALRRH